MVINYSFEPTYWDQKHDVRIPEVFTPRLAYLCGVLAGDGCIQHRPERKEYSVQCVGNPADEREYYNEVITPLLQGLFGVLIKPRLYDCGASYGFRMYSKTICRFLHRVCEAPMGDKIDSLHTPSLFWDDDELLLAYVRGVFDTDGCMCFKRKYREEPYYPVVSFTTKSEKFSEEVAAVLRAHGFSVVHYERRYDDERFSGETVTWAVELNGISQLQHWMRLVGFSNTKHLRKIEKWKRGPGKGISLLSA